MAGTLKSWGSVILTVIAVKACFFIAREGSRVSSPAAATAAASTASSSLASAPATSNANVRTRPEVLPDYERKQLPDGIEIDVPRMWRSNTEEENQLIALSAGSAAHQAGLDDPDGGKETVLMVYRSVPASTYAAVRVKQIRPASVTPQELLAASDADVAFVGPQMREAMAPMMERQHMALIGDITSTRTQVSGHPALVVDYRRQGPGGPVRVRQTKIMGPTAETVLTTSYRESEAPLWQSVMDVMQRSIYVPDTL